MADIDFYQEDTDDTPDGSLGLDDTGGIDDDCYGLDDRLSPLQKLEKYMDSDNIFSRQMVAKSMLDTLRAVGEEQDECDAVLKAMVRLSDDAEPTVRSELMEQVPHVAMYCRENKHIFNNSVPTYILPMVVRYLNDMNSQVRKTSQAALLVLLEQELVDKDDIEEQVVSVISDLACPDSPDDFRTEAVALMSKMAPLLGQELTEREFLPRFCEMCSDPLFHVRKVCAANFGDICSVVGPENVEEHLLPKFYYLCEDGVWGVRKACAECFMAVSRSSPPEIRRSQLSSLFVSLLCDLSRWVRMAAFQALGPFISTYADPEILQLLIQEGIAAMEGDENCEILRNAIAMQSTLDSVKTKSIEEVETSTEMQEKTTADTGEMSREEDSDDTPNNSFNDEDGEGETTEDMDLDEDCDNTEMVLNSGAISVEKIDDTNDDGDISVEEVRYKKSCEPSVSSETLTTPPSGDEKSDEISTNNNVESSEEQNVISDDHSVSCDIKESAVVNEVRQLEVSCDDSLEITEDNLPTVSDNSSLGFANDSSSAEESSEVISNNPDAKSDDDNLEDEDNNSLFSDESNDRNASIRTETTKDGHVHIHVDNVATFNTFQFWRAPLPTLDLDLDLVNGTPTHIHVMAKVKDEEHQKIYASEMDIRMSTNQNNSGQYTSLCDAVSSLVMDGSLTNPLVRSSSESDVENSGIKIHTASVSTVREASETVSHFGSTHVIGHNLKQMSIHHDGSLQDFTGSNLGYTDNELSSPGSSLRDSLSYDDSTLSQQQDVIPAHLLEHYLSMVDPSRAQTVDSEITRHCAYSFPAVAFTLGRKNWPCLKILYETLASDMQWKVRRTLAFSIHELAVIVGEEITHNDLVPIFDGFLKDLDEVRIGVLKHLADFLRLLKPGFRQNYLRKIQDFLTTDNQRNWRFRMELADQLILLCELFTGRDICEHLVPIGMALVGDKVSEVRQVSSRLLAVMMRRLTEDNDERMIQLLVNDLIKRFANSNKWNNRQLFAQLCQYLLEENSMALEKFASLLLPTLLSLTSDDIPNVRISLAKSLSQVIMPSDYFTSYQNPMHEDLLKTIQLLKGDPDRDVRYFSSLTPEVQSEYTDRVRLCRTGVTRDYRYMNQGEIERVMSCRDQHLADTEERMGRSRSLASSRK